MFQRIKSDIMEDNEEKRGSLTNQSAWLLMAKVIGFALSFLLPLLVVRILDKAAFGVYRQVFVIIVNATGILAFGVGLTAYYFLAREKEKRRKERESARGGKKEEASEEAPQPELPLRRG